ncbi:hypothetical protein RCL1_008882 [Eukaryota sp. TZLM3-RCL]
MPNSQKGPRARSEKFSQQPANSKMEQKMSDKRVNPEAKRPWTKKSGIPEVHPANDRNPHLESQHPARMGKGTVEPQVEIEHVDNRARTYPEKTFTSHKDKLHGSGL